MSIRRVLFHLNAGLRLFAQVILLEEGRNERDKCEPSVGKKSDTLGLSLLFPCFFLLRQLLLQLDHPYY